MDATAPLTEYIKAEVSHPDDWIKGDSYDGDYSPDSYPTTYSVDIGCILYEWYHETREEHIQFGCVGDHEVHSFSISIISGGGMYHAHGAANFERAIEACSTAMFMMNHAAHSNKREAENTRELRERIEELEEACDAHSKRANTLESKNETLRNQLTTLINTVSTGYDEGNWYGMIEQPQIWRPPTSDEIRTVTKFIDNNWYTDKEPDEGELSYDAKEDVQSSYLIVLDDFNAIRDHFQDKMLIYFSGVDGLFTTFFWDEHSRVHQINQDEQMRNVGENNSIFKDSN